MSHAKAAQLAFMRAVFEGLIVGKMRLLLSILHLYLLLHRQLTKNQAREPSFLMLPLN